MGAAVQELALRALAPEPMRLNVPVRHGPVGEHRRQAVVVDADDREEHQHGAGEGVEEELDRRVLLARPAPHADEEVHRQEHDLPEHVEEEHVQGDEGAHHAGLQEQQHDHVAGHHPHREVLRVVRVVVPVAVVVLDHAGHLRRPRARPPRHRGDGRDEGDEAGQEHHRDGEPVDPDVVLDVERADPHEVVRELHARVGRVVHPPGRDGRHEGQPARRERDEARAVVDELLREVRDAADREQDDDRGRSESGKKVAQLRTLPGFRNMSRLSWSYEMRKFSSTTTSAPPSAP